VSNGTKRPVLRTSGRVQNAGLGRLRKGRLSLLRQLRVVDSQDCEHRRCRCEQIFCCAGCNCPHQIGLNAIDEALPDESQGSHRHLCDLNHRHCVDDCFFVVDTPRAAAHRSNSHSSKGDSHKEATTQVWDGAAVASAIPARIFLKGRESLASDASPPHCNFAYSVLACFRMGISGSASFQRVRKP
jgi:hypothetical protein